MLKCKPGICIISFLLLITALKTFAQTSVNDTIRLGAIIEKGQTYPMAFLPEFVITGAFIDADERARRNKLRNDIYTVYPFALTASVIFKDVNSDLDKLPNRRSRKDYLKTIDKKLDNTFKEPLKNLSIDQGHVLIKLINRQTGQDCYSIIKELKGGFSAVLWQSVGVIFNNNLRREYDPDDRDKEIEDIVRELEASNAYKYHFYKQQEAMLRKVGN